MYRIPKDLDLHDIVGSEIQQICVGRYDVQFRFGTGCSICIQSIAEVLEEGVIVAVWNEDAGWSTTRFFALLHTVVLRYGVAHDRMLEIEFQDNLSLRLYDNSDQYESIQIYPQGYIV